MKPATCPPCTNNCRQGRGCPSRTMTAERLREILYYDPETGTFTWKVKPSPKIAAGSAAGGERGGYVRIKIGDVRYGANRLAWLYMTGSWPTGVVDHKNGVRNDNRWENLRDITPTLNRQNVRGAQRNNALGVLGVSRRCDGAIVATIDAFGRRVYLGRFSTVEAASAAYNAAKRELHPGATT